MSSLQLLTRPATATLCSLTTHNICYNIYCAMFHTSISIEYAICTRCGVLLSSATKSRFTLRSYDKNVGFKIQFWHHRISTAGRTRAPLRESRNFWNPIYSHVDFSRAVSTTNVDEWWDQSIACWFYATLRTACERWKNASEVVSTWAEGKAGEFAWHWADLSSSIEWKKGSLLTIAALTYRFHKL